jgi:histone deacetylase complex regulatory component SIN3
MGANDEIYLTRQEVLTLDTKINGAAKTIQKVQEGFEYLNYITAPKFKRNLEFKCTIETLKNNITTLSYQLNMLKRVTEGKV